MPGLASPAIGREVTGRIVAGVVRNAAIATALHMESFMAPISQDPARAAPPSPDVVRALDEVFRSTALGKRVVSCKIWHPDGTVLISSDRDIVCRRFPVADHLKQALGGHVSGACDAAGDEEDAAEAPLGLPLPEICSPVREV